MSEAAVEAYRIIATGGDASHLPEAVTELRSVGLVVPLPGAPERLMTVDPQEVLPRRREELHQAARALMDDADAIVPLQHELTATHRTARADLWSQGIERPASIGDANRRIAAVLAEAAEDLLTMQPGHRDEATLESSADRDFYALSRGIKMRTLYMDSEREYPHIQQWVAEATRRGAEIRTMPRAFMKTIIIDQRIAVISDRTRLGGPQPVHGAALIVHDAGVVGELVAQFERDWAQARTWDGTENAQVTAIGALSQVQQDVLLGLVGGATQRSLEQRLGMSVRQIERTITEIKRVIDPSGGPVSAAQMGYWCGRMQSGG
ncbi:hypothetical protein [Streptacidiphilus albus]|uniref:hypothetical protein n=1 Tax=Streptacidiphilus albus TaxID=105425 RepID=UPI00054B23FC|nr:hypothetical protein [Streptacidiphilus albus]